MTLSWIMADRSLYMTMYKRFQMLFITKNNANTYYDPSESVGHPAHCAIPRGSPPRRPQFPEPSRHKHSQSPSRILSI